MNIILCSDELTILKLKKAGFKVFKEEENMTQFLFNKNIKFNFSEFGSKVSFTDRMCF